MSEIVKQDYSPAIILGSNKSKAEITLLAKDVVQQEMDEGFIKATEELVTATRLKTFFEGRVDALRSHALNEMREDKNSTVLGASLSKSIEGGKWEFEDQYLATLKEEIDTVKEKAKKKDPKDRIHLTLAGELITISQATKIDGKESVKVTL